MSIREITMYQIACDHPGCDYNTGTDGDYSGWGDTETALDDWRDSIDGQTSGDEHYCPPHRRHCCADCGNTRDLSEWAGDHYCPAHIIDAQMENPR